MVSIFQNCETLSVRIVTLEPHHHNNFHVKRVIFLNIEFTFRSFSECPKIFHNTYFLEHLGVVLCE